MSCKLLIWAFVSCVFYTTSSAQFTCDEALALRDSILPAQYDLIVKKYSLSKSLTDQYSQLKNEAQENMDGLAFGQSLAALQGISNFMVNVFLLSPKGKMIRGIKEYSKGSIQPISKNYDLVEKVKDSQDIIDGNNIEVGTKYISSNLEKDVKGNMLKSTAETLFNTAELVITLIEDIQDFKDFNDSRSELNKHLDKFDELLDTWNNKLEESDRRLQTVFLTKAQLTRFLIQECDANMSMEEEPPKPEHMGSTDLVGTWYFNDPTISTPTTFKFTFINGSEFVYDDDWLSIEDEEYKGTYENTNGKISASYTYKSRTFVFEFQFVGSGETAKLLNSKKTIINAENNQTLQSINLNNWYSRE